MTNAPVIFGLTGLGGYAGGMCERLLQESAAAEPIVRLAAVCEPQPENFPALAAKLRDLGIPIVKQFSELVCQDIEAVWLPLPIHLHRSFTEAALSAGKAVLCEKPAAGCVEDVDAMIQARDRAKLPVAIGYQDIYQPAVQEYKRRLVAGDFGRILDATVLGCWPRGDSYFRRNDWAGKLRRGETWVLDSPLNNALAHFVHLTLFLLGASVNEAAEPKRIEAELYRVNTIENFETCTIRLTTHSDVPCLIALTHASNHNIDPEVEIHTEQAKLIYRFSRQFEIHWNDGRREALPLLRQPYHVMLQTVFRWLREGPTAAIGASLEMARTHTVAVNLVSEASRVIDVPADAIEVITDEDTSSQRTIPGISNALRKCVSKRVLLHETGLMSWSRPAGTKSIDGDYTRFAGPLS